MLEMCSGLRPVGCVALKRALTMGKEADCERASERVAAAAGKDRAATWVCPWPRNS